ncbi:cytochrome P450 [Vitiosangium sp. GDMCC 1.1324]|uniref:cytochrome P450 n=1 Tax=Vitiosangium sp. (strain GDMCC 1.1324) TaxID=2138576 RepID=UPI000D3A763A|nr:cytochrome P450 [Vitiosangium sp. GDMCC 1.1324]PTL80960.1 cytochrome P450 [Vitiosangium sp. GDMCC 1.1324]
MSSAAPTLDRNLVSPQNMLNPFPLYQYLRENEPVHWSDTVNAWFVTRYNDVVAAYRDPRLTANRAKLFEYQVQGLSPDVTREFMQTIRNQMFMLDGPEHVRLRRQTGMGFTPQKLDELRPTVHRLMRELLEQLSPRGEMDLVKDLSYPMPALAIADLLGIPAEDRERFRAWSDHLALFSSPPVGSDPLVLASNANKTMVEMKEYLLPIIEERRHHPGLDALSQMLMVQEQGKMTPEELVANAILILFAGHTTTTDQLSNGVYDLLTHPDQLQKLRDDMGLLRSAVEEMLRYTTSVPAITRVVASDFEWHGQKLRQGQLVFLVMAAANRDPSVFPDPERFDITRDSYHQKHLSFGFGAHHCMGAGLARRELEIGISMLLERLPGLRLDESRSPQVKCHGLSFRGFDSLPVRW